MGMLDGATLDIARDAHALIEGAVTHLADLGNGFVVRLGFADPGGGEPDQSADDDRNENGEFPVFFHTMPLKV
jgi:hypothetical protein